MSLTHHLEFVKRPQNNPMKILAIISTKAALNVIRPEAEQFIAMHNMGIKIDIICYANTEYAERFKNAGLNIVGEFPKHKKDKAAIVEIRNLLITNKYDIVHALHRTSIACSIQASKGLAVKLIAYRGASGLYWHDPTAYENALNPRIDKVICVCDDIRKNISKQLFFKRDKAVTIYKGHNLEWYAGIKKATKAEFNIPQDAFTITWVANNRKWKDLKSFLGAINNLPTKLPIHALIIGEGIDTPFYQKLRGKNKNADKIHFLGYRKDVLNIVAMSDVYAQTSYKNEGLSRSTIEAMSLGTTPIVTNAGGNPELVAHKDCGIVVPVKNSHAITKEILNLYNNPRINKSYGEAATKRIKSLFSVEKTAKETSALYRELIKTDN